jgi:tRNA dimethylallyltransferase
VESMFQQGLVEETVQLMNRGLERNPIIMQAIGYRQVVEFIRGKRTHAAAMEEIRRKTRQLAKRQTTWFKNKMEGIWINIESDEQAKESVLTYYHKSCTGAC